MAKELPPEIPLGMRRVCRRFERWRNGHKCRLPLPEALWAAAAAAAREHGVFQTAKVLRLEYGKLKRMAEATASRAQQAAGLAPGAAAFLELTPAPAASFGPATSECVIELEGPRGKMRIQWKGATALDLAALSRALWEPA